MIDNLERQLINEQLAKCIELSDKYNELVQTFNLVNFVSMLLGIALAATYFLLLVGALFYFLKIQPRR